MTSIHSFLAGKTESSTAPADFAGLIRTVQFLNKNAIPHYRTAKDYTADIDSFFKNLRDIKPELLNLFTENLGYSLKEAERDLQETLVYAEHFPAEKKYRPLDTIPEGLIAVFGSWSSPVYRFIHHVLPALASEGSVLLFCEPEVSAVYCLLAEKLRGTSLADNRLAVLPVTDRDVIETLVDHPSIRAVTGQMFLYQSPLFRDRPLSPEKNYSLHFGAHNPVLILNDAEESAVRALVESSLQYHIRGELRFNRWFVQEKIHPDVVNWIRDTLERANRDDYGKINVRSYLEAFQNQQPELKSTKHWIYPEGPSLLNVTTDFSNCSPLHQTELLGPLLTVTRFKNGVEATKFAGTTHYSNATCIVSASKDKYTELAGQQRTPFVFHNTLPGIFDESLNSGTHHCALVTAASAYAQKRIIVY